MTTRYPDRYGRYLGYVWYLPLRSEPARDTVGRGAVIFWESILTLVAGAR